MAAHLSCLLVEEGLFVAVGDLQVAVIDFELKGAESLAINRIFGIASGPIGAAWFEAAIRLLRGENLGKELGVVELPIVAAGLEEGLRVIIPAVQVAVLVPIQWLRSEECTQKFNRLFD